MFYKLFKSRYSTLVSFILVFLIGSFVIRTLLFCLSLPKADFSIAGVLGIFGLGIIYDLGVALLLTFFYNLYLLFFPSRWSGRWFDKIITCSGLFLMLLISFFSFFAEITFWQEFESRFNFIAVDYLIYTYEVIHNINESYPLPLLIGGVLALVILFNWIFAKAGVFQSTFKDTMPFKKRMVISSVLLLITVCYPFLLSNSYAESSTNRYQNELAKAGIYSFFSAFKNNELNYRDFYSLLPEKTVYEILHKELSGNNVQFIKSGPSIRRYIKTSLKPMRPNVIMITVESLSAEFMAHFGNTQHLMPILDSVADHNLLFTNMYATGTRTVRGMEALSLSIPPTPGSSIVRRQDNRSLSTVGHIFEQAGYARNFYYGGDGYFDNMNEYFGGNGFDIIDRGRDIRGGDSYLTKRTVIGDSLVHFENAWGISDGDLFDAVLRGGDAGSAQGKPFYDFVMTTSNHRPFTFPENKIAMKSGSREAALMYTDYAIGKFLRDLKAKKWYKNTVVIIVADHCAGSAGKNEVEISKYHIPAIILNLPMGGKQVIDKMCSQIDLYPTLFAILGWSYESNLFGSNVLDQGFQPRALLGTYQKLAYLKSDSLVILGPQRKVETYLYNHEDGSQKPSPLSRDIINEAKANYQGAYELYKNGSLHQ